MELIKEWFNKTSLKDEEKEILQQNIIDYLLKHDFEYSPFPEPELTVRKYSSEEVLKHANFLFNKYYRSTEIDFKMFRCDYFLSQLLEATQIKLSTMDFGAKSITSILVLDNDKKFLILNKNQPVFRRNFTIARALGHYYFHRKYQKLFIERSNNLFSNTNNDMDKTVNGFASDIVLPLVPLHIMLKSMYSFGKISISVRVSHECLRYTLIRYLVMHYKVPYNQSVQMVKEYEEKWVYGEKGASKIFNFVQERALKQKTEKNSNN